RLPGRIGADVRVGDLARPPDSNDRPPEDVAILDTPALNASIGHGDVDEGEHAGVLSDRVVLLFGDEASNLIVEARRVTESVCDIIAPENADLRLVGGARRWLPQIDPQVLGLIERVGELLRGHVRNLPGGDLVDIAETKRSHAAPGGCQ